MKPLTISDLERATGIGRDTIHYYIGEGLIPPGQKASATRAVYDRSHVDLLEEIARLKAEGLSLREIRERLRARIEAAGRSGVDLVAQQNEDTREAILQTSACRFAEQGYERTRISDICSDVGVAPQVLYAHFPSKRHLFIACYDVYSDWMHAQVTRPIEETADSAARLAWRSWASYGIQALSPDLQALARVEAFHPESELRSLVREIYGKILAGTGEEIAEERGEGAGPALFDDELVAYAFLGALENMQMRASWDESYGKKDVMRNLLAMFLAVRAAYAGRVQLGDEWELIEDLVERLAETAPLPPGQVDCCENA